MSQCTYSSSGLPQKCSDVLIVSSRCCRGAGRQRYPLAAVKAQGGSVITRGCLEELKGAAVKTGALRRSR